jgi:hypothetical protein
LILNKAKEELLEDGTFPEAGSVRRPLLQESSVPEGTLWF